MTIPQSIYVDGTVNLNLIAHTLHSKDAVFRVHYWGGTRDHVHPPMHQHSFFEICYVLDGHAIYTESGVDYPLQKNSMFLTRPYIKHNIHTASSLFFIFVAFEIVANASSSATVEMFSRLEKTHNFYIPDGSNLPAIRIWEALLQQSFQEGALVQESVLALSCALLASFAHIFSDNIEQQDSKKRKRERLGAGMVISQSKLYIRDNLGNPSLSLVEVAHFLHLSGRHFSRIFKEELGQSFTSYVRKERIRQASILLTSTKKSIKQISEETGFENVHYFTRVFSEIMEIAPRRFIDKFNKK
ncbi:hypothetical protein A8709_13945 [Paenibacillus pectinilyticus]|uniref:HTH araC/xylS-type domain-containing protein n=1 Tax=Paenibacillus pectinilyticus TaxID=512399 RepID=A0A1C1A3R3_9BACL|nr:AraC family transcriptional regulator [Paenibacillus pectinilyticus]OCT15201.1 hypothetical protein A8709_13945 [Paenibacillus pectinilyticus]